MPDIWYDVDTALAEVPVNIFPLTDDTDFKTIEGAVAYNAAGMALRWHFVTTAGAYSVTSVTPTMGGNYDWTDQGDSGIYTIEIPASGGASINNDTEGFGWFTGSATGILPWRGPVIGFRAAGLNDLLIDNAYSTTRGLAGTALPAAAADAAGGLVISDAGGLDIDAQVVTKINSILDDTGTAGVVVASIAANAITATAIADNAIDAGAIASNAITAAKIATGAITSAKFAAGAIDAAAIANGAIDAATFAADVDAEAAAWIWNAAVASFGGAGTYGQAVEDTLEDTGTTLPGTLSTIAGYIDTEVAAILADTNELQTDLANGGRLDLLIDAIKAKTDSLTFTVAGDVDCNVQTWKGSAAADMTGDAYARLGAPAGASVSADVAAVKSDTAATLTDTNELQTDLTNGGRLDLILDAILEDTGTTLDGIVDSILEDTAVIGAAGAGLSAIPWNAAWDVEVQSEVFDALDAAFTDATGLTANGLLDRIRTLGWLLRNKIEVTDANGNTVIYKDDSTTPAFSVNSMLTDDSTTTTRLRAA